MHAFTQITYYDLSEADFQSLVRQEFGLPNFEIPYYDWDWVSASTASYTCTTTTPDGAETDRFAEYLAHTKECDDIPDWSEFLNELVRRGRIPDGNYLVYMLP